MHDVMGAIAVDKLQVYELGKDGLHAILFEAHVEGDCLDRRQNATGFVLARHTEKEEPGLHEPVGHRVNLWAVSHL